jgi:hypothetical protein
MLWHALRASTAANVKTLATGLVARAVAFMGGVFRKKLLGLPAEFEAAGLASRGLPMHKDRTDRSAAVCGNCVAQTLRKINFDSNKVNESAGIRPIFFLA